MALDWYMKKFRDIYPSGPKLMEAFPLYQRALSKYSELDVDVACERALSECKYFPTPAELISFIPKNDFIVTAEKYEDPPLSAEDRALFNQGMEALKIKLGVKPRYVREKNCEPFPRSQANYEAMVGSQTLRDWAVNQNLGDDTARSVHEVELIRQVKGMNKKGKRRYESR